MSGFDPSDLIRHLKAYERRSIDAAKEACVEFAEHVLSESQDLCPVSPVNPQHPLYTGHSGALRDSGTVKEPVVSGGKISVDIGYNTDYAAAVHERLDANHKYPGAVNGKGQAKFLEQALRDNADKLMDHVRDRIAESSRQ